MHFYNISFPSLVRRLCPDLTYLQSLSLPLCFPSLFLIVKIYWKDRPGCIMCIQELLANNGLNLIFSLSSSSFISLALSTVLSPFYSFVSSLLLFLAFPLRSPIHSRSRVYLDIAILPASVIPRVSSDRAAD